ncbi:MAG TPA: 2-amino-4-hydroxy-6-hydroxymethyldihydropteridine diphosphokinase [Candidatus Saccharimonadia bacterium]|jgi:2-amino-4-hydroxy-6-hydroxymethyldihydropteridine diphosphokinase|nr:2-amino-4-hydroxy-6-hydroxymethyldihydropteridine diphosphokinase [Candidatus Saccharimonadia bacterium]
MVLVFLALGANVGDRHRNIEQAVELLGSQIHRIKRAPLYASQAVGYTDQPDFFNTVVSGETSLSPHELLRFVKDVEREVGRLFRFRWGPREIDVDIIFYGGETVETRDLTIPHRRFRERDFVLRPLCDLDAKRVDPVSGLTCAELLQQLPESALSIKSS